MEKNHVLEITVKAIIVAIVLTVILAASDAYLALKVGSTIAASIPAAVISMGVFRLFKNSTILESNLVQTAASAGEGMAGICAFILPALIILGYWSDFKFWQVVILTILGGFLGVFFSVPLRRILLNYKGLTFPEGTAVGNVLKASTSGTGQMKILIQGTAIGGLVGLAQTGFRIIADHLPAWFKSNNTLFGLSFGFNPALLGVGYIVGVNIGFTMLLGTIAGWIIGVPILSHIYGIPAGVSNAEDMVMTLWSQHIRYMGVGTMMVGGVWTLITVLKSVIQGLSVALRAKTATQYPTHIPSTEKDINIKYVMMGVPIILFILFFVIWYLFSNSGLAVSKELIFAASLLGIILILILGLLTSLIAGYLVGLIGSSNSPFSGLNIMSLLLLSTIMIPLIALQVNLKVHANQQAVIAIIIFILTVVASAFVITLENMQDLKAGQIVGATPWKQQVMMMIGVVAASLAVPPVLHLLFQAYGMGGVFPHPGMDKSQMLAAPQSGLIAALGQSIISLTLPWKMFITGAVIGLLAIIADEYFKRRGKIRLPALCVGLGIYLPPELVTCIFLGGLVRFIADRILRNKIKKFSETEQKNIMNNTEQRAMLLACGLVAGTALMGVILAIPFVIKGNSDVLRLVSDRFIPISYFIGVVVTLALCYWLYRVTTKIK